MKKASQKTSILLILLVAVSYNYAQQFNLNKNVRAALSQVDTANIKRDITYLADDKLLGRLPGTPGYKTAVDYVVERFKEIGLAPAGDNGTFVQTLLIRKAMVDQKSALAILKDKAGNTDTLVQGKEIFLLPNTMAASVKTSGELVFAGYGLDIPGKYSDYTGLDVKGKIVVVINGTPPTLVLPTTLVAHFANPGSKMAIASDIGAKGMIIIQPVPASANASVSTVSINPEKTKSFSRLSNHNLEAIGRMQQSGLQRLFMNSGKNLATTLASLNQGKPSSFPLNVSIDLNFNNQFTDTETYNVIAKIQGTDPVLKDEYVIHTAHLDHVGIGKAVNGDSIYNGAHDNASGVASLLEIARTYKKLKQQPRRSVLIVMVTAEEMGLLGSAYFAGNPTVPVKNIVADVNTDMPTLIAPFLSATPLGAEHSSLATNVDWACKQLGLLVQKDPMPEENRFIRSDQYSFVLAGIPALHIKYGTKTPNDSFDLVAFTKEWRDKNYHKPSDEITNGFMYSAAKKYVQLNFLISYSIAQTTTRPSWNTGDFFNTGN